MVLLKCFICLDLSIYLDSLRNLGSIFPLQVDFIKCNMYRKFIREP